MMNGQNFGEAFADFTFMGINPAQTMKNIKNLHENQQSLNGLINCISTGSGVAEAAKNVAKAVEAFAKNEDATFDSLLSAAGVNTKDFFKYTDAYLGPASNDLGETFTQFLEIKGEDFSADLNTVSMRVNTTKMVTVDDVATLSNSISANVVKPTKKNLSSSKAWIAAVVIVVIVIIAGVAVAGFFLWKKKMWFFAEKKDDNEDNSNEIKLLVIYFINYPYF